jgi:predicted transcriptional regulator
MRAKLPIDEIAKCLLSTLSEGPKTADALTTTCTGGAARMLSPRLVWLEGLGLIEGIGAGMYSLTDVGKKVLEALG